MDTLKGSPSRIDDERPENDECDKRLQPPDISPGRLAKAAALIETKLEAIRDPTQGGDAEYRKCEVHLSFYQNLIAINLLNCFNAKSYFKSSNHRPTACVSQVTLIFA